MITGKTIVCYSGTNWDIPWGISQKVMLELSKYNKIIFIEYQPSFLHCWFKGLSYDGYSGKNRGFSRKINDSLYTYSPKVGLPFNNYFRGINILNHRKTEEDIRREIGKKNPEDVIIWAFVPQAIDFVKGLGKLFTVYHCLGNYSVEKANFLRKKTVSRMEMELVGCAGIIVGQTRSLCAKFRALGKKTFYFPSAANFKDVPDNKEKQMSISRELKDIAYPRIGILGYFDDTFYDTGLLRYLMNARKNWSFIFIGPVTGKAKEIALLGNSCNAFFLGRKNPEDIPHYIKMLDVGIIPYKVNGYMCEVSPNKFYEYIACRKPVVSTALPDISNYNGILKIAKDGKEFLKSIEEFLYHRVQDDTKIAKEVRYTRNDSVGKFLEELSTLF